MGYLRRFIKMLDLLFLQEVSHVYYQGVIRDDHSRGMWFQLAGLRSESRPDESAEDSQNSN